MTFALMTRLPEGTPEEVDTFDTAKAAFKAAMDGGAVVPIALMAPGRIDHEYGDHVFETGFDGGGRTFWIERKVGG